MRTPGQAATTAKTGLAVGSVAAPLTGALVGTLVGGPVGTVIGGVLSLLGAGAGAAAGLIDPARAAKRTEMMQRGFPRDFADEYAKSSVLDIEGLKVRAAQLADKAQWGDQKSMLGLKAVRALLAERASMSLQEQAAALIAQRRSGRVPLWAPVAFLAIVGVGIVLYARRRR